jgi:septal ring factor EnvC (AmiA/AmiB activator)
MERLLAAVEAKVEAVALALSTAREENTQLRLKLAALEQENRALKEALLAAFDAVGAQQAQVAKLRSSAEAWLKQRKSNDG